MSMRHLTAVATEVARHFTDRLMVGTMTTRDTASTCFGIPIDLITVVTKFLSSYRVLATMSAKRFGSITLPFVMARTAAGSARTPRGLNDFTTVFTGRSPDNHGLAVTVLTTKRLRSSPMSTAYKGVLTVLAKFDWLSLGSKPASTTDFDLLTPHGMTALADDSLFGHNLEHSPFLRSIPRKAKNVKIGEMTYPRDC